MYNSYLIQGIFNQYRAVLKNSIAQAWYKEGDEKIELGLRIGSFLISIIQNNDNQQFYINNLQIRDLI